jgi:hypothetical protein
MKFGRRCRVRVREYWMLDLWLELAFALVVEMYKFIQVAFEVLDRLWNYYCSRVNA